MSRKIKLFLTDCLAKQFQVYHNNYISLYDFEKQKTSKNLCRFMNLYLMKNHKDKNINNLMNIFNSAFDLYFEKRINRDGIFKYLYSRDREALEIFNEVEETVGYFGTGYASKKNILSGFLFGTFFRDLPNSKMIPTVLKMETRLYYLMYCKKNWIKYIAFLMVYKKSI